MHNSVLRIPIISMSVLSFDMGWIAADEVVGENVPGVKLNVVEATDNLVCDVEFIINFVSYPR